MKEEKKRRKPLKRAYQAPGCVISAKIKRIKVHLQRHENDRAASMRLAELERSLE